MFPEKTPLPVQLREVYCLSRRVWENGVAGNILGGTPHTMEFSLTGSTAHMTVDGLPETASLFPFPAPPHGCFSLASNATLNEPGAFRYIRLKAEGKMLLDLDFRQLDTVETLETYFQCYYFPDLQQGTVGQPVPVSRFWGKNSRGCLHCKWEQNDIIPQNDCGPMCLLTWRAGSLGDFEVELGFEQCWRRYGILFGCEQGQFSYYSLPHTRRTAPVAGGFAYIGAEGSCDIRGALQYVPALDSCALDSSAGGTTVSHYCHIHSFSATFTRAVQPRSLLRHTLTYHIASDIQYHLSDRTLTAAPGTVLYMPPQIPCSLSGTPDRILRIEFDPFTAAPAEPALLTLQQPETVRRLFEKLLEIWCGEPTGKQYPALAVFYQLLAELQQQNRRDTTALSPAVNGALLYIDTHFSTATLTVSAVAKAVNVSESYLYQLFREAGEISPKEYILHCRVRHACALLQTHYYKVYEIAERCGFTDAKYFMTAFKRIVGVTPGQYAAQKND